jgi:glycosyltransferase involved in cell wall biosynthesis
MSTGCLLVASDTPPVREVIEDGVNGILVDFFSPQAIVEKIEDTLDHPDRMEILRINARKTILKKYRLSDLLPKHLEWIRGNMNTLKNNTNFSVSRRE